MLDIAMLMTDEDWAADVRAWLAQSTYCVLIGGVRGAGKSTVLSRLGAETDGALSIFDEPYHHVYVNLANQFNCSTVAGFCATISRAVGLTGTPISPDDLMDELVKHARELLDAHLVITFDNWFDAAIALVGESAVGEPETKLHLLALASLVVGLAVQPGAGRKVYVLLPHPHPDSGQLVRWTRLAASRYPTIHRPSGDICRVSADRHLSLLTKQQSLAVVQANLPSLSEGKARAIAEDSGGWLVALEAAVVAAANDDWSPRVAQAAGKAVWAYIEQTALQYECADEVSFLALGKRNNGRALVERIAQLHSMALDPTVADEHVSRILPLLGQDAGLAPLVLASLPRPRFLFVDVPNVALGALHVVGDLDPMHEAAMRDMVFRHLWAAIAHYARRNAIPAENIYLAAHNMGELRRKCPLDVPKSQQVALRDYTGTAQPVALIPLAAAPGAKPDDHRLVAEIVRVLHERPTAEIHFLNADSEYTAAIQVGNAKSANFIFAHAWAEMGYFIRQHIATFVASGARASYASSVLRAEPQPQTSGRFDTEGRLDVVGYAASLRLGHSEGTE